MYAFAAIALVFAGETLCMIAELIAARNTNDGAVFAFWTMFALATLAGACLVGGYMLGYVQLKNI